MGRVPLVPVFLASCRIRQCSHPHRCAARVSACSPDRAFVDRERYGRNGLLRTGRSVAARPGAWETLARLCNAGCPFGATALLAFRGGSHDRNDAALLRDELVPAPYLASD